MPAKLALSLVVSTVLIYCLSYLLSPDLDACSQLLICIGGKPVLSSHSHPENTKSSCVLAGFVSSICSKSFCRRPDTVRLSMYRYLYK